MTDATAPLIRLTSVTKQYQRGGESLTVLHNLDLQVPKGSFEALMGPSGSGKTTLLNLMAGLDKPTSGSIEVAGKRIDQMGDGALAAWRASSVGFVFQSYNLLPVLTAVENVELPLLLTPVPARQRRKRAETALRVVGLQDRLGHYPRQLSGGQEQRVAIARAIVNDPVLIVADEPTGDLDRQSADEILKLLETLNKQLGKTIMMVTHDPAAAERATITHHLDKGRLSKEPAPSSRGKRDQPGKADEDKADEDKADEDKADEDKADEDKADEANGDAKPPLERTLASEKEGAA